MTTRSKILTTLALSSLLVGGAQALAADSTATDEDQNSSMNKTDNGQSSSMNTTGDSQKSPTTKKAHRHHAKSTTQPPATKPAETAPEKETKPPAETTPGSQD